MSDLLEIQNLSVSFDTPAGEVQAVRDVSLSLPECKVLALVGESGCGKSVLCRSMMKLLPRTARIKSGSIVAEGVDITNYGERDMRKLRGSLFAMVFQDPMTTLNPVMPVGDQIAEAVRVHNRRISKEAAHRRAVELMKLEQQHLASGIMPSVVGMGAKDAVYLLERAGLKVNIAGVGKVTRQSIPSGNKYQKGQTVALQLH